MMASLRSNILIIIVLVIMIRVPTYALGLRNFPSGISFEAGGGYNQLLWHGDDFRINRTAVSLTPLIRFLYVIPIRSNIELAPFAGYNKFGGSSGVYANGYKDQYWWRAFEFGAFGSWRIKQYKFGPGVKFNKHVEINGRYYGSLSQSAGAPRSWHVEDWTDEFAKSSLDFGLRATWGPEHMRISIESWFGGSDLLGEKWDEMASAHENHFRLLIGYEL